MNKTVEIIVDTIKYANASLGKHHSYIIFEGLFTVVACIGIFGMVTFYRLDDECHSTNDILEGEEI